MPTNRLLLGIRGERSQPFDKTDGEERSPRMPFVLVIFLALGSSFGLARLLATLIDPPRLSPLPRSVVGVSEAPDRARRVRDPAVVFDAEAFKRTIIENNLFRPLGWTPPRPIEPYRLIGTLLPKDDRTPPTAILQTTAGQRTLIVSTGEQIDAETEVVEINRKQVVLETDGQQRTLRLAIGF